MKEYIAASGHSTEGPLNEHEPDILPIVRPRDREFIAGTLSADSYFRAAYQEARVSAEEGLWKTPKSNGSPTPHYISPLDDEARDFVSGRLSATDYFELRFQTETLRARREFGSSGTTLWPVVAGINPLIAAAGLVFLLLSSYNDASGTTGLLIFISLAVVAATAALNGWRTLTAIWIRARHFDRS